MEEKYGIEVEKAVINELSAHKKFINVNVTSKIDIEIHPFNFNKKK